MSDSENKTENGSLSEQAYSVIRGLILENTLPAGQHVLEKTLVDKLAISRTPIREACVQLEREGLIEIRPRKGIYIKPISAEDMSEIYDILTALEAQAAGLIAEKVARGHLAKEALNVLHQPTLDMQKALENNNLTAWAEADEAFHFALLKLCGNQRLKAVVLQFWGQSHRARYFTLRLREKPTDSTADHQDLAQAIAAGDSKKARQIHSEHRLKGKRNLLALIETHQLTDL